MITNHDLVIDYLAKWLADYAKAAGRSVFVVGFRGCRADAVLLHICAKAAELYGGLSVEALSCSIDVNIRDIFNGRISVIHGDSLESFYLQCHKIAEDKGIVVGPIDRTFGLYYRSYGKRAEGSADIFPLFDIDYSDISAIAYSLWDSKHIKWDVFDTKDLGIISTDVEFANDADALYGIITSEVPPNQHPRWPYFIGRQKEIISKVWQREKATRHKKLDRPYPTLSDRPQFIRRA